MNATRPATPDLRPVPSSALGTGNRELPQKGSRNRPEPTGTAEAPPARLFEPLADFLARTEALPPMKWLIDGLVPDSGRVFVVAAPNAGKTWLAFVIAKTAAAQGRSVFLVLEEGQPRSMYERFTMMAFDPALPIQVAHLKGVQLGDRKARGHIAACLRSQPSPVLILDPFVSLFLGDENDTRAMNQAKTLLEELARANPNALLVLLHHTSKAGERGEGAEMHAARGSSILSGWADVQLNLTHESVPPGSGRVAFTAKLVKARDGERGRRERFTISLGDGQVTRDSPSEASLDARAAKVLELLGASLEPMTATAIAEAVGGRRQSALDLVKHLESEGEIEKDGGKYRRPKPASPEDVVSP